jgi:hypothetical protein
LPNFKSAITQSTIAVKEYLLTAPAGTVVRPSEPDKAEGVDARVFAAQLGQADPELGVDHPINIVCRFGLDNLPEKAETLTLEIGEFFEWVWPFFEAARGQECGTPKHQGPKKIQSMEGIDEDAPQTLELS